MIRPPEEFAQWVKPCCSCATPTWWVFADTGNPACFKCALAQGRNVVNAVPQSVRQALARSEMEDGPAPRPPREP